MLDDLLAFIGFAFFLSALGVIVGLILLPFKSRRKLGKFLAIVSGIICVSSLTIAVLLAEPTAERKAKLEKREAEVAREREEQIAVARQREDQIKREREEQIRREKEEQTEAAARKKSELAIAAARREYELRAEQEKLKTTPQLEVLKTTPQQLFNAYENNEVAADNWLKGKIIEITGVVQSIDKSILENIFVSLATKNEFLPAKIHYGSGISSQEETKIAALRRGQTVVFRCRKMHRWVGSPMGEDCVLMSAY